MIIDQSYWQSHFGIDKYDYFIDKTISYLKPYLENKKIGLLVYQKNIFANSLFLRIQNEGFNITFIELSDIANKYKSINLLIDCMYLSGLDYHISANENICNLLNNSDLEIYSLDINYGAMPDGQLSINALHSKVTIIYGAKRPFHILKKNHHLFEKTVLFKSEYFDSADSLYLEIDEKLFFKYFKNKKDDDYKGSKGKILLIGGSYGLAGSLMLNIIGARCGASGYTIVMVDKRIYSLVAGKYIEEVYYPFADDNYCDYLLKIIPSTHAAAYGSGVNNLSNKADILKYLLKSEVKRLVLDAEALRLLANFDLIKNRKNITIITPHLGEFAYLTNKSISEIKANPIDIAKAYANENNCILVLKGPHTIVADAKGNIYINETGNAALARTGSGDLLTGMIVALQNYADAFIATCLAVWLHGYLADLGLDRYSAELFDLQAYPEIMNDFLKKAGH